MKNTRKKSRTRGVPSQAPRVAARRMQGRGQAAVRAQRGITLVITIILLVILSLIGTLNMRNATVSEQASNSLRTSAVAQQAAELGLQYCEQVAMDTAGVTYGTQRGSILKGTITAALSSGAWAATSTWVSTSTQLVVASAYYASGDAAAKAFVNAPRCVIEPVNNTAGAGYLVTARGFGNDAVIKANGAVTSGAEVWLQSLLVQ